LLDDSTGNAAPTVIERITLEPMNLTPPRIEKPTYVLNNVKWGSPTLGSGGGIITWSLGPQVPPGNPYTSAATAINSTYATTIRAAFQRWDQVANFTFVEVADSTNADIHIVFDELESRGAGVLGVAHTYSSGGVIAEAFIRLDLNRRYRTIDGTIQTLGAASDSSSAVNLYVLSLHEIGHALGLGHEDDFLTVMNSFLGSSLGDLTSDEITAIQVLYGGSITTPVVDDYPGNNLTTGSVAIGGATTGALETTGDRDWFAVNLSAGTSYRFDLRGGTLTDPYLYLRNSAGLLLASDDDSGIGFDSLLTYTATASGTYYLEARAGSLASIGTYTLLAGTTTASIDDYTASTSTTGIVAVGGSATGRIEAGDDSDWFRVTLTAGTTYRIDLRGTTLADPYLYLRNIAGVIVGVDDDTGLGLDAQLFYTAGTTGTYYIDAQSATLTGAGTYTVSVASVATVDDYGANTITAGSVAVGGTASGNINVAGDSDWFRITLTAKATYQFDLRGVTLGDAYLTLRNSTGGLLASDDDSGDGLNARFTYTPIATGTYYLDAQAAGSGTGTYTLSTALIAAAPPADDHPGSAAGAPALELGGTRTGNIEASLDTDWFRVTLETGLMYRFRVEGSSAGGGTLAQPLAVLYNDAGHPQLASGATVNEVVFTPTVRGSYYLVASGIGAGVTGTYTVSASVVPDDFAENTSTTGTLTVGSTKSGRIDAAFDSDWFRVTLNAEGRYRFFVSGADGNGGNLADPKVGVYDANGKLLTSADDGGFGNDGLVRYTPTQSGVYYVSAAAVGAATGTYTVGVREQAADDFTADTKTTGAIKVGAKATGTIEATGDHDWFSITLAADTTYQFDVVGTAPGSGLRETDSFLSIRNSLGEELDAAEAHGAGATTRLTYTAKTAGTYYLDVQAYRIGYGTYSVQAAIAAPAQNVESDDTFAEISDLAAITAPPAFDLQQLFAMSSPDLLQAAGITDQEYMRLLRANQYAATPSALFSSGGNGL